MYNVGLTICGACRLAGFWGPAHYLDGYAAGPPPTWSSVTCYSMGQ